MKYYSFCNHNGVDVNDKDRFPIDHCAIKEALGEECYINEWPKAEIIFAHINIERNDEPKEIGKFISPEDGPKIFLIISNEDFSEGNSKCLYWKPWYFFRIINQKIIKEAPQKEALQALLNLTQKDAEYIFKCFKENRLVEFSKENAVAEEHSSHENPEDYKWLNLLFNKPANSDTLVAWYILAQTYTLHTDKEEQTNLLDNKKAWQINPATPAVAKERIEDDIETWINSRNLSLPEEVKNNTIEQLKAFAEIVYGVGDGNGKIEISENDVRNVFKALQPLFFAGAEK